MSCSFCQMGSCCTPLCCAKAPRINRGAGWGMEELDFLYSNAQSTISMLSPSTCRLCAVGLYAAVHKHCVLSAVGCPCSKAASDVGRFNDCRSLHGIYTCTGSAVLKTVKKLGRLALACSLQQKHQPSLLMVRLLCLRGGAYANCCYVLCTNRCHTACCRICGLCSNSTSSAPRGDRSLPAWYGMVQNYSERVLDRVEDGREGQQCLFVQS